LPRPEATLPVRPIGMSCLFQPPPRQAVLMCDRSAPVADAFCHSTPASVLSPEATQVSYHRIPRRSLLREIHTLRVCGKGKSQVVVAALRSHTEDRSPRPQHLLRELKKAYEFLGLHARVGERVQISLGTRIQQRRLHRCNVSEKCLNGHRVQTAL